MIEEVFEDEHEEESGVDKSRVREEIKKFLALPDEGPHEAGWRYPKGHVFAGEKEKYLKKSGTVSALANWIYMALRADKNANNLFGEDKEAIINRLRTIFAKRADGLITDSQVSLLRNVGRLSLALLDSKYDHVSSEWEELKDETDLDRWKNGYTDPPPSEYFLEGLHQ